MDSDDSKKFKDIVNKHVKKLFDGVGDKLNSIDVNVNNLNMDNHSVNKFSDQPMHESSVDFNSDDVDVLTNPNLKTIGPKSRTTGSRRIKINWSKGAGIVSSIFSSNSMLIFYVFVLSFFSQKNPTDYRIIIANIILLFFLILKNLDEIQTEPKKLGEIIGLVAFQFGFFILISYIFNITFILDIVERFMFIIKLMLLFLNPLMFYFIFLNPDSDNKLTRTLKIIFIILVLLFILLMFLGSLIHSVGKFRDFIKSGMPGFKESFASFFNLFSNKVKEIKTAINSSVNSRLNPNMRSRIDANSRARLGVFIDTPKPLLSRISEGQPFDVISKIEFNTLFSDIEIRAFCNAKDSYHKYFVQGELQNSVYRGVGHQADVLQCSFNRGLLKGNYDLWFEALFNFETWAYIDYTFVDSNLVSLYLKEGKNIKSELDIRDSDPVFTDGPVKISMITSTQPLIVDFNRNYFPHFGLYISKNWQKGKIEKINSVVVRVPDMIELVNCSPADPVEVSVDSDFNEYKFDKSNAINGDLKNVVCSMKINKNKFNQELNINKKIVKTIMVKTDYTYMVKSPAKTLNVVEVK